MAKYVYEKAWIKLLDGTSVQIGPLKIKYLRQFMDVFQLVEHAQDNLETMTIITECATICMRQYYPLISNREQLEDLVDIHTVYKIVDICGGVKIDPTKEEVEEQAKEQSSGNASTWKNLDLPALEAEIFQLGAWKNFEELESSLTMRELIVLLENIRDYKYNEHKFLAAIQGIDLDKQTKTNNEWEEMKSRVFSGGQTNNPDDIISYQGYKAQQAGFGIGMGLDYVDMKKKPEKTD